MTKLAMNTNTADNRTGKSSDMIGTIGRLRSGDRHDQYGACCTLAPCLYRNRLDGAHGCRGVRGDTSGSASAGPRGAALRRSARRREWCRPHRRCGASVLSRRIPVELRDHGGQRGWLGSWNGRRCSSMNVQTRFHESRCPGESTRSSVVASTRRLNECPWVTPHGSGST